MHQNFQGKYPPQIWSLFFSEMWERFSFYGMRGMLMVFMVSQMHLPEGMANLQYGATQALVYAFTFVGGLLADKFLGFGRSLLWGGFLMIIGSIILAIHPQEFFFLGIAFNIVGTGFFKPNISTMVGRLYHQDDPRRDAGFSLFYAGVNLGGLLGGYLCIAVANGSLLGSIVPVALRWNVAFGFAAVVMLISLVNYYFTRHKIAHIIADKFGRSHTTQKRINLINYLGSLLAIPLIMLMVSQVEITKWFMFIIGPAALLYMFYEISQANKTEQKRLLAALVFIIFSIFFWAFFEQSGGSLSLFAQNNLQNQLIGITLDPVGVNNSANSFFVIIFAGLLGLFWLWLAKKKAEPNSIVKFGLGFLCLALGFYLFYFTKFFADQNGRTSLGIFSMAWLAISFGELCLSPIGMSLMTKLSPQRMQSILMGIWFLASAYGQYFAGLLGANMAQDSGTGLQKLNNYCNAYGNLGLYALCMGLFLIIISPWVKRLMIGLK